MSTLLLHIKRYKCFRDSSFRIKNLTVLAGRNSVGKSSITQALRLLRESAIKPHPNSEVHLNGSQFLLGSYDEIVNSGTSLDSVLNFEVSLSVEDQPSYTVFSKAEESDDCEYLKTTGRKNAFLLQKSSSHFIYLSAERQGPRLHQEQTDGHREKKVELGTRGEFAAEVLVNNEFHKLERNLVHPSNLSSSQSLNLLGSNLESWMSTIVGPVSIRAIRPGRFALPYIELSANDITQEWRLPTNCGFGISYSLPIVLAGLLLDKKGFLIVDSPEAHLHPAAQTAMALFLARVAATGRRVIVETHSDHVLDGFRLAIADHSHPLSYEQSIFHYLDRSSNGTLIHHELEPKLDGSLSRWPKGFFDQTASNLHTLSQLTRNGN